LQIVEEVAIEDEETAVDHAFFYLGLFAEFLDSIILTYNQLSKS